MSLASQVRPALSLLALFTALTGLAYPALVTGIAQATMPYQANGSLIVGADGVVIGSDLIGQPWSDAGYFAGRPSATAPGAYDAAASSGSNLGPTHPALGDALDARATALRAAHGEGTIPVDLLTASGSGLDPDITPAAALYQVERVARARALSEERVRALVLEHVEERFLGVLGEPRVNVLRLNLALDRVHAGE